MVLDQQIPEPSDGIAVRNLVAGLYFTEIRKRAAVNDFFSGSFVRKVVQVLGSCKIYCVNSQSMVQ